MSSSTTLPAARRELNSRRHSCSMRVSWDVPGTKITMNAQRRTDTGNAQERHTSNMRGESIDESAARIDNNGWRGRIVHGIFACAVCKILEKEMSFKLNTAAKATVRKRLRLPLSWQSYFRGAGASIVQHSCCRSRAATDLTRIAGCSPSAVLDAVICSVSPFLNFVVRSSCREKSESAEADSDYTQYCITTSPDYYSLVVFSFF